MTAIEMAQNNRTAHGSPRPDQYPSRIREIRKLRGMTLKVLAGKIGTTPQTAQRLETGGMTLSLEWMNKIAKALMIEVADLVNTGRSDQIPLMGYINERGRVTPLEETRPTTFHLEVPSDDPIAVRVNAAIGPFEADTVLIANRLRADDIENALGADCLVALESGATLLRRVIRGKDRSWTLVPYETGGEVQYNQTILWAARILMMIRYY